MRLHAGALHIILVNLRLNLIGLAAVHPPGLLALGAEVVAEGLEEFSALLQVNHTGPGATGSALDGTTVAVLAGIFRLEGILQFVFTALQAVLAGHFVQFAPFHLVSGKSNLDGFGHGDGVTGAVHHALLAAVADMAFVDGIRFQFGIREQNHETHTRAEFRRKKHLGPAEFSHTCQIGGDAEVYQHVRMRFPLLHGTAPAFTELAGDSIDGFTAIGVDQRNHLIAMIFHKIAERPHHHGAPHLIKGGITHGGIGREEGALFDTSQ